MSELEMLLKQKGVSKNGNTIIIKPLGYMEDVRYRQLNIKSTENKTYIIDCEEYISKLGMYGYFNLVKKENRTMDSTTKVRTVKSLMRDIKNEKINFEHLVQRQSNQWSKKQQELLIDSLLKGIVLPQIVFIVQNDITYVLDGKQRLTTIDEYIKSKEFEILTDDEKDLITSSEISTITYSNVNDDEIFELFKRYNNGVNLAGGQKTRSFCNKEVLLKIKNELKDNDIKTVWNITKGQAAKDEDEMVMFQTMMLVSNFEYKNFSNKEVERFLEETSKETLNDALNNVLNNVGIVYNIVIESLGNEKQKNLKKIHLPFIFAFANDSEEYKNKLINFLTNYSSENSEFDEYRSHCTTGTSQKEHVQGRLSYWK